MAIKLEDYEKYLEGIAPEIRDVLEGTFTEASHVMSPTGMENYLEGAKSLANLGRGKGLPAASCPRLGRLLPQLAEGSLSKDRAKKAPNELGNYKMQFYPISEAEHCVRPNSS